MRTIIFLSAMWIAKNINPEFKGMDGDDATIISVALIGAVVADIYKEIKSNK